ncbi:hypothetical protein BCR34DRAFT_616291 [Clohesyomyces aquaticus]|uniref:Uncharacterized protein n=1 Tax=Clohesyomyces aquaticus TaxID=1231657 RepID=A0A1Y1ZEQ0_9PLEO|nr:hypothetical protein BCR34DRAFT_616291 [Clohesyomyces aquaticus]
MKVFLLLAALLAALTFGAPTDNPRDSLILRGDVPGLNVTHLVNPDKTRNTNLTTTYISPRYTEQAAPIPETKTAFDIGTTVKEPTIVRIAIKDKPANIGDLDSAESSDAIKHALEWLCPLEDDGGNCRIAQTGDDGWPKPSHNQVNLRLSNGAMLVFIERGHFTSDAMRKLMIRSIAATISAAAEYSGNHGDGIFKKGICNVPSYVGLAVLGTPNILDVHFRWIPDERYWANVANTQWDCEGTHWVVVDHFRYLMADWNKELHETEKSIFCV